MTLNPPGPADPETIKLISGMVEDEEPDNEDAADLIDIVPPYTAQTIVAVSLDARLGAQFKLSLAVSARDCDGRKIVMRDCVAITVVEC
jgi:hypothetical protein